MLCGLCDACSLVPHDYNTLAKEEIAQLFNLSTELNHGKFIVHGLFARADTRNTNGRVYPKSVLQREVKRFKQQHIRRGTALGELNHPSYTSSYFRSLNLPNISHQVLDVFWRGRELWGTLEVLPTPAGLLLWELYSKGIKLGVSSRGWASVVAEPAKQRVLVDNDFQLITFDFVTEPSNAGAYLVPICRRYRHPVPDQSAAVHVSYLGVGSMDMGQLHKLPSPIALNKFMRHITKTMAARTAAAAAAAATSEQQQQLVQQVPLLAIAAGQTLLQPPPTAVAVACSASSSSCSNIIADSSQCPAATASRASISILSALQPAVPATAALVTPCAAVVPADTALGGGVILGCHYRALADPWLPCDPAGRDFAAHLALVASKAQLLQQKQEHHLHRQQKQQWLHRHHSTHADQQQQQQQHPEQQQQQQQPHCQQQQQQCQQHQQQQQQYHQHQQQQQQYQQQPQHYQHHQEQQSLLLPAGQRGQLLSPEQQLVLQQPPDPEAQECPPWSHHQQAMAGGASALEYTQCAAGAAARVALAQGRSDSLMEVQLGQQSPRVQLSCRAWSAQRVAPHPLSPALNVQQ